MARIAAALAVSFGLLALGVARGGDGQLPKAEPIAGEAIAFVASKAGSSSDIYKSTPTAATPSASPTTTCGSRCWPGPPG